VKEFLALNQLRLSIGRSSLRDEEIHALHSSHPLLFQNGKPVSKSELATSDGLFLSLDLKGDETGRVGYRARDHAPVIEIGKEGLYDAESYWEPVYKEDGDRIVLVPQRFYLLLSEESVRIPPGFAAEMTAYDPTSGELRTHYAGFFDPGFGHDPKEEFFGSRAALEVRAHDVPFMIEHGQRVCKLTFEHMLAPPDVLYGHEAGSSYQQQSDTLSKHFRSRLEPDEPATEQRRSPSDQTALFDEPA
jgi:dCTP deaminase